MNHTTEYWPSVAGQYTVIFTPTRLTFARSAAALPRDILEKIDSITRIDDAVFAHALRRLWNELRALEAQTNATLLCPDRVRPLRALTAHIPGLWSSLGNLRL